MQFNGVGAAAKVDNGQMLTSSVWRVEMCAVGGGSESMTVGQTVRVCEEQMEETTRRSYSKGTLGA